jgi:hypothetical protein
MGMGCYQVTRKKALHDSCTKMQNRLSNRMCGNNKLSKARDLFDELGADIVVYSEHRQNLQHLDYHNSWNQLFKGGGADIQLVVAHNLHESKAITHTQKGGTGLLMFGQLTEYLDMPGLEKDTTLAGGPQCF